MLTESNMSIVKLVQGHRFDSYCMTRGPVSQKMKTFIKDGNFKVFDLL